ncbi:helix-turn-helix transcriptional regulator [Kitasatospora sp. NBC_00240]|uniref:helix-turn-helix domain-containing protein n=1 Tax=Kitasatospora sp. NBC_00240 TaxID=2903567 RepID=UPI00224D8B4A|nr:helix-turn-helix transcriptional regulator [Kitasatospora sp. NBC_00240]MCX5215595.1 helix-turn-helix transcriptional regulator [Kitasatospora sp. NBC_00240]
MASDAHARLKYRREYAGLSIEEFAEQVGVTARTVRYWEAGQRQIGDRHFGRVLNALGCDAQALGLHRRGEENLRDLRRQVGLSAVQVATHLGERRATAPMGITADRILVLERGERVQDTWCTSAQDCGTIAKALAALYGVSHRLLADAWRRTNTTTALPDLATVHRCTRSPIARQAWEELNDRQRLYLLELFHQDQDQEQEHEQQVQRCLDGSPRVPAAQWRKFVFCLHAPASLVGRTPAQERLRAAGVHDPGAGSSLSALERRGLVLCHHDTVRIAPLGEVKRTRVELTRAGRSAARAGLGVESRTLPPQMLSEWLWRTLVRIIRCAPLSDGDVPGRGTGYLAVGRSVRKGVPARGFIEHRQPPGASGGPHYWYPTRSGLDHAANHLAYYRKLYPSVNTEGVEEHLKGLL